MLEEILQYVTWLFSFIKTSGPTTNAASSEGLL